MENKLTLALESLISGIEECLKKEQAFLDQVYIEVTKPNLETDLVKQLVASSNKAIAHYEKCISEYQELLKEIKERE